MNRKITLGILLVLGMLILGACSTDEEETTIQMTPVLNYTRKPRIT